mgnify:CR=1 FL=1
MTAPARGGDAGRSDENGLIAVLAFAGIVMSLSQTLVIPLLGMLPAILNTSAVNASWVVTITLLAGAVLTETIFSWPGIGSWVYEAISQRDYPVIQGGVIFAALVVSIVNLLVDLSYAALDPRIQYR